MSHLTPERFAELADEQPTAAEAAHLASCAHCAHERAAHAALVVLAADERERPIAPLSEWDSIADRLRANDLIAGAPRRSRFAGRQWLEAAAAVLLIGGGAILGRYSAGPTPVAVTGGDVAQITQGNAVQVAATPVPYGSLGQEGVPAAPVMKFASTVEAATVLARAAQEYQAALAYLAQRDTLSHSSDSTQVYRTRLAALDAVANSTKQAMEAAPYDPVINQYYLTTMGAREATLRQLGRTLPADVSLTRY